MQFVNAIVDLLCSPFRCRRANPVVLADLLDDPDWQRFLKAIRFVETGNAKDAANAIGDNGRSLGPYQIGRAYWKDSRVPGHYEMVRDDAYAKLVIVAYLNRYQPQAVKDKNWEVLARTHNGGPNGPGKPATLPYWQRMMSRMAFLQLARR